MERRRGETFVWEDVVMGNTGVYAPGTTDADGNDISGQPNTTAVLNDIDSYALGPLSGFTGASRPFIEIFRWKLGSFKKYRCELPIQQKGTRWNSFERLVNWC